MRHRVIMVIGLTLTTVTLPTLALHTADSEVELPNFGNVALNEASTESELASTGLRSSASRQDTFPLQRDRFQVQIEWQAIDDTEASGTMPPLNSGNSGVSWFFYPDNLEMLVKVLDGCSLNGHLWVFAATAATVEYTLTVTDTLTDQSKSYYNPPGKTADAIIDTGAFNACSDPRGSNETAGIPTNHQTIGNSSVHISSTTGTKTISSDVCIPSSTRLCLLEGRFSLELEWQTDRGQTGQAQVVPIASDTSGLLWFFHQNQWELLAKIFDRCEDNGHFWVFAATATDLGFTLRVTDTETGIFKHYSRPLGGIADAMLDTYAFATCL